MRAGEVINISANAPHQFQNKSKQPARLLCVCSPAGQEEFFLEVGVPVATRTTLPPVPDRGLGEQRCCDPGGDRQRAGFVIARPPILKGDPAQFRVEQLDGDKCISVPGYIYYVSSGRINLQLPWELQGQPSAQVRVIVGESTSSLLTVPPDAPTGVEPVVMTIGGVSSPASDRTVQ